MLSMMDLKNLVLRPNCLITPSDLVFIPGPCSLFFHQHPFAQMPEFLFEHGYRTQLVSLPSRFKKARAGAFTKWLSKHSTERFHFILADVTYLEIKNLIPQELTASLTLLSLSTTSYSLADQTENFTFKNESSISSLFLTPLNYRVHQLICLTGEIQAVPYSVTFSNAKKSVYDRFLDHCIKLAENELYA